MSRSSIGEKEDLLKNLTARSEKILFLKEEDMKLKRAGNELMRKAQKNGLGTKDPLVISNLKAQECLSNHLAKLHAEDPSKPLSGVFLKNSSELLQSLYSESLDPNLLVTHSKSKALEKSSDKSSSDKSDISLDKSSDKILKNESDSGKNKGEKIFESTKNLNSSSAAKISSTAGSRSSEKPLKKGNGEKDINDDKDKIKSSDNDKDSNRTKDRESKDGGWKSIKLESKAPSSKSFDLRKKLDKVSIYQKNSCFLSSLQAPDTHNYI